MKKIALFLLMLMLMTVNVYKTEADKAKPAEGIITLYSPENVFNRSFIPRDVAMGFSGKSCLFYLLNADRQIIVYDASHKPVRVLIPRLTSPDAIAVDSAGHIYVADANANQIEVLSSQGEVIRTLSAYRPYSLAALSNGNIVVASPSNGRLLQVYDSSGRLVNSFGRLRPFESTSDAENNFLNRGRVLVDSADTIYFVYTFAPVPMAQRYSAKGILLSEFTINGDAIDVQLEPAKEFLKNRPSTKTGGINIINAASIDPETGHLWIGMNGSTDTGVLYDYKPNGKKLHEYSLFAGASSPIRVISGVGHAIVRTPSVYVFTAYGAFRFDLNRTVSDEDDAVYGEELCPQENPPGECKTTCGTADPADDKDCKAELMASVNMTGRRIIYSSCSSIPSSCHFSMTLCQTSNGVQTTHEVSLNCGSSGGGGGG